MQKNYTLPYKFLSISCIRATLLVSILFLSVTSFAQAPTIVSFLPQYGAAGSLVTVTGTNLNTPTTFTIGGTSALVISNNGTQLVGMVMPGAATGAVSISTINGSITASNNFYVTATSFPHAQQNNKLIANDNTGAARQGYSVALSANGNTAIVGGYNDNTGQGAAWIYTRNNNIWTQQGSKLVGSDHTGAAGQGISVAINADGNTAIVGGYNDNGGQGAAWVFTRTGSTWLQQGSKLTANDNTGAANFGNSISISADGNTAVVGGYGDNNFQGAAWVFTRSNNVWAQQGNKLVGTGYIGSAYQGRSVAISANSNTVIVGGMNDNNSVGAAWVYTRTNNIWTQEDKLIGTGYTSSAPSQGISVALSADGNTAVVGGSLDNINQGALWVYTRFAGAWAQQGNKLIPSDNVGATYHGISVSLTADGNTILTGGFADNSNQGAAWIYTRNGTAWLQQGNKLKGTGNSTAANQGYGVAISADGNTGMIGGYTDNTNQGAVWPFTFAPIWTGNTSTAWATAANWNSNTVPTATDNVVIPNVVNAPIISTTQAVNNIIIESGASVTVANTGTIKIAGAVTNLGAFNAANGSVEFNGTAAQTIASATFVNNTVRNIAINNTAGVSLADTLKILGTYTPVAGFMATYGKLVLISNSNGTASIAAGNSLGGYFSGAVRVEKYIACGGLASASPSKRAYRFFSHPFNTAIALNQLTGNGEIDITGEDGTANGFSVDALPNNAASAYQYNTATGDGNTTNDVDGWVAYTAANINANNNVNSWKKHKGLRVFVRGTKGQGLTGDYSYTVGSPTLSMIGNVNTGDQTVNLVYAGANWNFVGNPFASPVNLQTVARNNVSNMVYVWRLDMGNRGAYSAAINIATTAYYLPAYSAFFVQTTDVSPSMIFEEADKVATETSNTLFRNNDNDVKIRLQLKSSDDAMLWDETYLTLSNKYKPTMEIGNDGLKLSNATACLYSLSSDGKKLSLDARDISLAPIQLGLTSNIARGYKLFIDNYSNNIPADKELWLHDKYIDSWTKLHQTTTYGFDVTTNTNTQGENRFELVAKTIKPAVPIVVKAGLSVSPSPATNIIYIAYDGLDVDKTTTLRIIDVQGKVMNTVALDKTVSGNKTMAIKTWANGLYTVQLINGTNVLMQTIIKQ